VNRQKVSICHKQSPCKTKPELLNTLSSAKTVIGITSLWRGTSRGVSEYLNTPPVVRRWSKRVHVGVSKFMYNSVHWNGKAWSEWW